MIPILLAGLAIGAVVVVACWDDIIDFMRSFANAVKEKLGRFKRGVQVLARRLGEKMGFVTKAYYEKDNEWYEETTTRKIDKSEVPAYIMNKIKSQETDVTEEFNDELKMAYEN